MGLLLNVPYAEKDEAKALGARWNPDLKKWYAPSPYKYPNFYKWMDLPRDEVRIILIDHLYVVEGHRTCYKCGKTTKVMCFGVEDFYEVLNPEEYGDDIELFHYCTKTIHLIPDLPTSCIPSDLWKYMDDTFHFHEGYSKQGGTYRANHCHSCGAIQGEFYLFAEPDSPFFITSPYDASQLILYKFHLKNDLILGDIIGGDSPCDAFIKPNAKIIETNQEI
ncbi:MAG: DUF5710 domain-containing protein [Bacteroides sp.]|nr:DUF5710 domain-containing protein [Bacteroides sp.]MCM1550548.1 DUF5710 domain-containing protein [Clostridium sp.]